MSDAASNVWEAKVPAGTLATQLYVDGKTAPIDQQSPKALQLDLSNFQVTTGFDISGSTASFFQNLAATMTPAELHEVRFVWNPTVPTAWEESECPVGSVTATAVVIAQLCWDNLTNKEPAIYGGNSSNVTPYNLKLDTAPSAIDNTYVPSTGANPPASGEWYLDQPAGELYYAPWCSSAGSPRTCNSWPLGSRWLTSRPARKAPRSPWAPDKRSDLSAARLLTRSTENFRLRHSCSHGGCPAARLCRPGGRWSRWMPQSVAGSGGPGPRSAPR